MKRNMGTTDRLIRSLLVAPGAIVVALLVGPTVWGSVAWVIGGLMIVTAAIGFCPLYALLGISTRGRERELSESLRSAA